MHWAEYFGKDKLKYAPCFDSRTVCYPNDKILRDYLSWRQADCHINNLFNTTFWALVQQGGMTEIEAEDHLKVNSLFLENFLNFSHFIMNRAHFPKTRMKFYLLDLISTITISTLYIERDRQLYVKRQKLLQFHQEMVKKLHVLNGYQLQFMTILLVKSFGMLTLNYFNKIQLFYSVPFKAIC
jgi:tRNA(His) guanylyltransferase